MPGPLKQCAVLAAVTVGLWLLLVFPAYLVAGGKAIEGLTISAILCLLPGWVVFVVVDRYRAAFAQGSAVLFATGLRMIFVLAGVFLLLTYRPEYGLREFFAWLVVFYSVMLMVETLLLLRKVST